MGFKENLKEAMFCKNLTTIELANITGINSGIINIGIIKSSNSGEVSNIYLTVFI